MPGAVFSWVLFALLVVVCVAWLLRRNLKRKAAAFGREHGENRAALALPGIVERFGRTLDLQAPVDRTQPLVEQAFATSRSVKPAGPGQWQMKYLAADDVRMALVPHGSGSRLVVTSFREYGKIPQGAGEWEQLRDKVAAAAEAAGIGTTLGHQDVARGEAVERDEHRWHAVATPLT